MPQRSCNNCEHKNNYWCFTSVFCRGDWTTSKDFCSKWKEKDPDLKQLIVDEINDAYASGGLNSQANWIIDYFKQRIEESVNIATRHDLNRMVHIDNVKKAFSWILDSK